MSVRVRFAPSPTGFVHIGSLRTALYNYLLARKHNGKYVLRIEDTDQTRLVEGAIENLLDSMEWAGIPHDEGVVMENGVITEKGEYGPYIQSNRLDIYHKHIKALLETGDAYHCFCSKERLDEVREKQRAAGQTAKYDGHCRELTKEEVQKNIEAGMPYVIRLKLPENTDIVFDDVIRGRVVVNTDEIDDQVLIKSDGFPTYHFAVVVDDHLMKITHVIRGEEWLPSTPKHVYLYQVLGWEAPKFVHLSNILNTDKKKLSKRHGDVAVEDFAKKGYLPEALVNFIALIGWSPEDAREIFSMEELISEFSLERVSRSGGVFDVNKLNWMNNHYIQKADIGRITKMAIPHLIKAGYITEKDAEERYEWLEDMVLAIRERLDYVSQIVDKVDIFFKDEIVPDEGEAMEILKLEHIPHLLDVLHEKISNAETIDIASIKKIFKEIQKEEGYKGPKLFKPIRVALTGSAQGPDLPLIMQIMGRENLLSRIEYTQKNLI
ncbi:MAG: glutamate--tRNA ligase [Clostridiales bacterium]|nr:glutamate--tRNA ligase [Clostridiales bacterium]